MLLGGKGGCQQCTCVPCDACTRTCQSPHTGGAFETVYTRYFESVEAGNPSDGYLSASGDSDTSDPYDGMDGSGPWYQQVSGTFTINSTQTRHPCRVTVSFWRNNYTLGAATIPPASTALTSQAVYVTVTSGAVIVGDRVIVPADGEVQITGISIPLVSGGGDQSTNIPRFYDGSISVAPQCESATFSIRARIEWNTKKRQHVLYGLVRECYEETPLDNCCAAGLSLPNELYVTISNYTGPVGQRADGTSLDYNGTYVLTRQPGFCDFYVGEWEFSCSISSNPLGESLGTQKITTSLAAGSAGYIVFFYRTAQFSGVCRSQGLHILSPTTTTFCGAGVIASGTNGEIYMDFTQFPFTGTRVSGSFDWEIEA